MMMIYIYIHTYTYICRNAARMPLQCATVSAERSTCQSSDFLPLVWVLGKLVLVLRSSEVGLFVLVRSSRRLDCMVYFSRPIQCFVLTYVCSRNEVFLEFQTSRFPSQDTSQLFSSSTFNVSLFYFIVLQCFLLNV